MGLRHADRDLGEVGALEALRLLQRRGQEQRTVAAVHLPHDGVDLVRDRVAELVRVGERGVGLGRVDDSLGERGRSGPAPLEALVDLGRVSARIQCQAADELDLGVGVAGEAVHGDDRLSPNPR